MRITQDILVSELQCAVRVSVPRVADVARRVQVVVVDGQVADVVRETDGEFSGRVVVSEEDVCEGVPTLFGWVELLQEGRGAVRDPGYVCDGLAARENDDRRDARVADCAD